jgi:uncharacterized integral membrane protein
MTEVPGPRPDHEEMERLARRRRRRAIRGIIYIFLTVVVVAFVIQNSQRVPVHFWFWTREARLIWVVLACLVAGVVFGYVLGGPDRKARRREHQAEKAARHGHGRHEDPLSS